MASKRSFSQFATVCIFIISLMGLICLSEGATQKHAPAPAPSPPPHPGNGATPPSAAAVFSPNSFVSILIAALMPSCLSFFY